MQSAAYFRRGKRISPLCPALGPLLYLLLRAPLAAAETHYVWRASPSPSPPYTSWSTAAREIQQAVDAAASGDLVLVTNGVYDTGGRRGGFSAHSNRVVVTNGIVLRSVNGPEATTIAGAPDAHTLDVGSNAVRCLYLDNGLVSGFTLSNGYTAATGTTYEVDGGGASMVGGVLEHCVVRNSRAAASGGGVALHDEGAVERCIVRDNTARVTAGGIYFNGAGVARHTVVENNSCINEGGGLRLVLGGRVENCTVIYNHGAYGGGLVSFPETNPVVNTIVYYNSANLYDANCSTTAPLSYCCSTPLVAGPGNIAADPRLANLLPGDYHLLADSPCIDAGTNLPGQAAALDVDGQPRLFGARVDMGADEAVVRCVDIVHTGVCTMVWETPPATPLRLQYTSNLLAGTWSADANTVTAGLFQTLLTDTNPAARRFYRLLCDWPRDPWLPAMITPYAGQEDMGGINEAYSETTNCPWGFIHQGIDCFPTIDLKEFQAAEEGVVEDISRFQNAGNSNWQVNVRIQYDDRFAFGYAFEPASSSSNHGDVQMANIAVTTGQHVAQGDTVGYLYAPSNGAHVHFDFYTNWNATCPDAYFIESARTSILHLLHLVWPGADMCY